MKLIDKYKGMSVQAKAAVWFTLCSIMQKGISFITVPIFTRLLSTEQYGIYSLYLSWLQILTIITSLYLYNGVFNNAMVKFENDRSRYIASMQGLSAVITTIVYCIYVIGMNTWSEFLGLAPGLVVLMFIEMFFSPAMYYWLGRQRFEYKYKKLVIVTLMKSIANPLLGLIAISLTDDKATARIVSVVIIEILFSGTLMIYQYIKGKVFVVKSYWKYALVLGIPLLPHYLSSMVLNQGDRIMISKMVGTSEVAFYSVAYNIGMLVQIFTNAINNSFTPWVYQRIKSDNYTGVKGTINSLLLIVAVLVFGLMMISPELVMIFGSAEYASAAYVIPPVAASVYFIFLYNILAIPQFYYERTQFLLLASISSAIINIVLNYFFISRFGYVAAGYTTLACYIMYSLGHYVISSKVLKKVDQKNKLFDINSIALISIVIVLMVIISNFLFDHIFIRFGVLAICIFVAWVKRDKIKTLIRKR